MKQNKRDMKTREEMVLISAAAQYANAKGIPLTKMSWALSSVIGMAENNVLNRLREASESIEGDQALEGLRRKLQEDSENDVIAQEDLEKRLGEVVSVEALSVRTYGVICKVEGTTRTLLLHLSEIADEFIDDISEYVDVGDTFSAMLIVNAKGSLGLSTRRYRSLSKKKKEMEEVYKKYYAGGAK